MKTMLFRKSVMVFTSLLALAACSPASDPKDPLESMNRGVFEFNRVVDNYLIGPVAKGYRYVTPDPIRQRIGNASDNLYEPVSMVNAFLQGDFTQGMTNFWRFVINSTVGLAGLHDVASTAGLAPRREDFGQTLAVWGVDTGPYLVLPLLGPSNLRDTGGKLTDWFATDPVTWAVDDTSTSLWMSAGHALVARERLIDAIDDVYETSLDPYATFRSAYEQHRVAMVKNTGDTDVLGDAK